MSARARGTCPPTTPEPRALEFIEVLWDLQPPEQEWFVEELLPEGALVGMIGPTGSGKTFAAVALAGAAATGGTWFVGRQVKRGLVIYLTGEDPIGVHQRIQAYFQWLGVPTPKNRIAVTPNYSLLDREGVAEMAEQIHRVSIEADAIPTLIVVDTMSGTMPPNLNEDNAPDVTAFMRLLRSLLPPEAQRHCVIAVVHHTGHKNVDRGRGSSNIKQKFDVEMIFSGNGEKNEYSVYASKRRGQPVDKAPHHFMIENQILDLPSGKSVQVGVLVWRGVGGVRREDMTDAEKFGWRALVNANRKEGGPVTMKTWAETTARTEWGKAQKNLRARMSAFGQILARKGRAEKGDDDLWTATLQPKTGGALGAPEVPEKRPNGQLEKTPPTPPARSARPPPKGAGFGQVGRGAGQTGKKMISPRDHPLRQTARPRTGKKDRRQP